MARLLRVSVTVASLEMINESPVVLYTSSRDRDRVWCLARPMRVGETESQKIITWTAPSHLLSCFDSNVDAFSFSAACDRSLQG